MASKSSKKKSASKTLYDNIVYIEVGASKKRFGIHKSLLCHNSAFFEAAFNGSFKEAEEGVVVLEDEDPETFQRFNEWLYTGILLDEQEKKHSTSYGILVDLYIFAEKRIVPTLQNDIIDALIRLDDDANECMGSADINKIWHHTAESSNLRRLALDQYVYNAKLAICFNWAKNGIEAYDADFVRQVAMGLWAALWDSDVKAGADSKAYFDFELWVRRCHRYHTHEEEEWFCEGSL